MLEVFLQSQTFRFPRGFLKFPSKCPGYIFGQGIIVGYGGASKMKGTPNKNPEVHHQVPNFTVFLWEYHVSGQIHACHGQKSDYIIYNYI